MLINESTKTSGAIYTPLHVVNNILNLTGYTTDILQKHIIDNSCGDGAFLIVIVERYIKAYLNRSSNLIKLKGELETYIHGIELNPTATMICLKRLDNIAMQYGLKKISWDIKQANTLEVNEFDKKMDFVVGNPPYIRVHNLQDTYNKVKSYSFASNGMTDLYIVFFEIGIRMLSETGRMGLITPSSFLRSRAGLELRKFFRKTKGLTKVVDLGHYQAFNATTYTMITVFDNSKQSNFIEYFIYDEVDLVPRGIDNLDLKEVFIGDSMFFSDKKQLRLLHEIEEKWVRRTNREVVVKNGFATLADNVFFGDFEFEHCVIDVVKASTGRWTKSIFPYDFKGKPMSLERISHYPDVFEYLMSNKKNLQNRTSEDKENWHLFGRSQAISDVFVNKIAVNTMGICFKSP